MMIRAWLLASALGCACGVQLQRSRLPTRRAATISAAVETQQTDADYQIDRARRFASMPPVILCYRDQLFADNFRGRLCGRDVDKAEYLRALKTLADATPALEFNAHEFVARDDGSVEYKVRMTGEHTGTLRTDSTVVAATGTRLIGDVERAVVAFDPYGRVTYVEAGEVVEALDDEDKAAAGRKEVEAELEVVAGEVVEAQERWTGLMGSSGLRTADAHAESRGVENELRALEMRRAQLQVRAPPCAAWRPRAGRGAWARAGRLARPLTCAPRRAPRLRAPRRSSSSTCLCAATRAGTATSTARSTRSAPPPRPRELPGRGWGSRAAARPGWPRGRRGPLPGDANRECPPCAR